MENKIIIHKKVWWWGTTMTLILNNGVGIIDISFDKDSPNVARLNGLSVLSEYQRQGLATWLLNKCHEIAKLNNCKFCQLDADKDNHWIRRWYESLGYTLFTQDDHYFTMIKILDD